MKKKSTFRSAFFTPRVLISLGIGALGVLLTLLAFGLYPGGKAFARQKDSSDQDLSQQHVPVFQIRAAQTAAALAVDDVAVSNSIPAAKNPRTNVPTAVFVVNTTADTQDVTPGDGICADGTGACSLRAAITEANALGGADTITLPAGTYTSTLVAANEDLNAGGDFDITSALTINGAGSGTTIIQAAAAPNTATERVIQITGAATTVNINNVTIRNGNSTVSTAGGGLRVDSATAVVNLTNVIITNNQVKLAGNAFGGGVFASLGTLTMTGCTVSNNSAISTSSSTNGFAGGIYNQQATVTLTNSTVTGNISSSFHGGIRTLSSTAAVATTNITNSTISNNVAQGLNGAGAPGEGGGVVNIAASTLACTTNITSSTVSGNSAQIFGAPGAGTFIGGVENVGVTTGPSIVNLTNSTVSGNSADFAGGCYSDGPAATMTLKYSTIDSNTATTQGGGVFQDVTAGGVTNLKSSIVADNSAPTSPDISGTITSQGYNHVENTAGGTFTTTTGDATGTDPALSPLQNNGGPTFTHIPLAGSPVLNTIPSGSNECGTTVTVDQRGIVRPQAGACDKGSVERTGNDATPTPTPSGTPSPTATATATIPPPTPTPTPSPTPVGCQVLYDQTDSPSGTGTNSQNFETVNDAFDDQAADDFVVPAGNTWTIQQVFAPGSYYNGAGPAASVNVIFYKNTGTLPDSTMVVGAFSNVVPVDINGSFTITLPLGGQLLTAGTYWISVQANLDFTPGGQWAWNDRSVTSNNPSAWQNPGNGFASGCTSWTLKTTCVAGSGPDMNFLLRGCLSAQSPTPTPPPVSISGTVTYCSNPTLPPVPGVTMTLTGTASGSTVTDPVGNYSFTGLPSGGTYTVTPSKATLASGSAGINTLDVVAAQRQFLNLGTPLTGCRLMAADASPVNGDGVVNTLDVIAIQRFFLSQTTGLGRCGKYNFTPASITYTAITTNQTAQNYSALVYGDTAGSPFVHRPSGPEGNEPSAGEAPITVAAVGLPEVAVAQSKSTFNAPVTTTEIDGKNKMIGFQGDLTFDEREVSFQDQPVSPAGLTARNWNVSGNVLPGVGPNRTLRISAYSNDFTPLSGSGTLFNLNMTRVGWGAQSTPLIWAAPPDNFIFIDADLNMQRAGNVAPGSVTVSAKN